MFDNQKSKRLQREERNLAIKEKKEIEKKREIHHREVLKMAKEDQKMIHLAPSDDFIILKDINKIYDNHVQAVFDFNLNIKKHEFIVFVGPSGCGKSTTLRMIAGLEDITSGKLFIDGDYANYLLPKDREIAMVFQSYALYPHMNVYKNMAFSLKYHKIIEKVEVDGKVVAKKRKYTKDEIHQRVMNAAQVLGLEEYLERRPRALSGGQCQRVALGRAIVRNPKVFLMDEPLSNLDAKLRVTMRGEIVALHKRVGATTIYVTHDQTEAMTMADRIVVMDKGYIQQVGSPLEIYNRPQNVFVATFMGSPSMNIIELDNKKGSLQIDGNSLVELRVKDKKAIKGKEKVLFGIRPEDIQIVKSNEDGFKVTISSIELLGNEILYKFDLFSKTLIGKTYVKDHLLQANQKIKISIDKSKIHLFDFDTKQRL